MTKVTFETAGLADALKEAGSVAPTRGEAFDKAAGIVLDVQGEQVVVMATDLRLRYMQWVTPLAVEGSPVRWRVPAKVFTEVITKLDMDSSRRLTLWQDGTVLKMSHGRKRGQFNLMDVAIYPMWIPFDPTGLTDAPEISDRINQVEWASSTGNNPPYTGIHFDGEMAMATDRYRFALTPCKILELGSAITVPAGLLGQIVRPTDSVKVRATETAFHVMPDDHTQVECVVYGMPFPAMRKMAKRDYPSLVVVDRTLLLNMMQVACSFIGSDRLPTMRLFFGNEQIALMMANQEIGHLGDVMDVPGQATHPRMEIKFSPKNIMSALENAPGMEVTLGYDPENTKTAFYIKGGDGVEFWLAPRQEVTPTDAE